MKILILAFALAAAGAFAAPVHDAVVLGPMAKQALALPKDAAGRHRSGVVRALPKSVSLGAWIAEGDGFVARARVTSEGAMGLRVRLDLGNLPGAVEVRVQGDGPVETMTVDPLFGPEAWTPWTDGAAQVIEVSSRVLPSDSALRIGSVVHMTESSLPKAAAACTVSTSCPSGDAAVDAAIAERKKSLVRMSFVDGGSAFVCSGTLIDTPSRLPYLLTANHCLPTQETAGTLTSRFFFEFTTCGGTLIDPASVQVAGGATMVFPNYNVDMTIVQLNSAPPPGVTYAPIAATHVPDGATVYNLSHPRGDSSRYAIGTVVGGDRNFDLPYDMYIVRMSKGLIEPGSSGSGLYSLVNGSLQLRGVTSAADDELSCTNPNGITIFGRSEVMLPQMSPFIGLVTRPADDAPNRVKDWAGVAQTSSGMDVPLNTVASGFFDIGPRQINYAGDVDVYRFFLTEGRVVTVGTSGSIDTVGTLMDSAGRAYAADDDANANNLNMGITRYLPAGTYYVQVAHWDPTATSGQYTLQVKADNVGETNYTALWWNPNESGWGVNVVHQGNIVFATLFTYDADGTPMWLVMSNGAKQADGSFKGDLARATGPVFNASPWTPIQLTSVGTMTISFQTADTGSLIYTVNGTQVLKSIVRQQFGKLTDMPTCGWSVFDRSLASNVQDLWWNPAESGWGINLTHQGPILFATLFTYGADRKARWYVMSNGTSNAGGVFSGVLYQTSGPPFNAAPWVTAVSTPVGRMSLNFTNGNAATLTYDINGVSVTKSIQRQVFASPRVDCEP
ncbi:hypothetical protein BWI17_21150 [Betaproteobacteria bacterium GR16-43]|nr:hypothetical protein BWI17_21150 [Betaproteobacteria bacterium GR16-43]